MLGTTSMVLAFDLQGRVWEVTAAQRCWSGAQDGTCSQALAPYGPLFLGLVARRDCP